MKKKKAIRNIVIFVFILLIILVGLLIYNNDLLGPDIKSSINKQFDLKYSDIKALGPWNPSGTIVYLNENEITYKPITDGDPTTYKPDIKSAAYQSTDDGSILILDEKNRIVIWRRDNIIKVISEDNTYNPLPILSPNTKQMAVVSFSNAERDFGYKLQIYSTNNEFIGDVYSSQTRIISPLWTDDTTLIFAIDNDKGSEIYSVGTTDKQPKLLFNADGKYISGISTRGNVILITAGDTTGSESNQSIYKLDGNKLSRVTNKKGVYKELHISPDEKSMAYLNNNSEVVIQDLLKQDSKTIGKATHFAGWIK